jgi:hypothetical protein
MVHLTTDLGEGEEAPNALGSGYRCSIFLPESDARCETEFVAVLGSQVVDVVTKLCDA